MQSRQKIGVIMLGWAVLLLVMYLGFSWLVPKIHRGTQKNASAYSVTLTSRLSGHFYVQASIGDQPVELMVDTGASYVSLPMSLEESLGLKRMGKVTMDTAGGPQTGYITTIPEIRVGPITLKKVRGVLSPNLDMPLLGMSFLSQVEMRRTGDSMTLTQRGK